MLSDRKVVGAGFQLIIRSGSVTAAVQKAVKTGLKQIGEEYLKQVKKNISLEDHTLQELRQMGHPYRVGGPVNMLHGDDAILHKQSGDLLKSIKLQPVEQTTSRKWTVYITSDDPMIEGILYGTPTMRPRPFHQKSYNDIKHKYWNPLLAELKKVNVRVAGWTST